MSHTIKIKDAKTEFVAVDQTYQIRVLVEVFNGVDEKGDPISLGERAFGYPTSTTSEEIKADLDRVVATLDSDAAQGALSAPLEEQLAQAEKTNKELLGGVKEPETDKVTS